MKYYLVVFALVAVGFTDNIKGKISYIDWLKYDSKVNSSGGNDGEVDEWNETMKNPNQHLIREKKNDKIGILNEGDNHDKHNFDENKKDKTQRIESYGYDKSYREEKRHRKYYGKYYDIMWYDKDATYYTENDQDGFSEKDVDDLNRYRSYKDQDWDNDDEYDNVNIIGLRTNDREDIVRPCALDDWQCIRKYFAGNSKCSPKYGPAPDPLYLKRDTLYYPHANVTQVLTNVRITGLGSIKISEFYINKYTGNLVIAMDFKNLNETIEKAFYRYKRTAKESIVLNDYTTIEFSSGTFTAVIPKIPYLRLDLAEIHAYIDDDSPNFFVGPEAANSTDPDVIVAFAELVKNLPITIREAFLFRAQLLTAIYIQKNICDFGLKLISI